MSNFKNYILKAQGETANIDISGFINENFSRYLKQISIIEEDLKFIVSTDKKIKFEIDNQTIDLESSEELTIKNFFNRIEEYINKEKIQNIKFQDKSIDKASFNLGFFIEKIKKITHYKNISENTIIAEKLQGFVFNLTSTPSAEKNNLTANALINLKDIKTFNVEKFIDFLKENGESSSINDATAENIFGTEFINKKLVPYVQNNFFINNDKFELFLEKISKLCGSTSEKNKKSITDEFKNAKENQGIWELKITFGPVTGTLGVPKTR